MPAQSHAAPAAPAQATCEIWIRTVGSRRQAFARPIQPAGQRTRSWHSIPVPQADKALRTGHLTVGEFAGAAAVPRETQDDEHPMRSAFAAQAAALNTTIDALNAEARGAA